MGNIKGVELVAVSTPFCTFVNVLYCHCGRTLVHSKADIPQMVNFGLICIDYNIGEVFC